MLHLMLLKCIILPVLSTLWNHFLQQYICFQQILRAEADSECLLKLRFQDSIKLPVVGWGDDYKDSIVKPVHTPSKGKNAC